MKLLDLLFSLLIPIVVLVNLFTAPYTKVEESFNIQATHDVLVYGTPSSKIYEKLSSSFDHFTFPGAVPRTFIGPVLLAGTSQPLVALFGFDNAQLIVRAVLGLFNASALLFMKSQVHKAFCSTTARWYAVLQASQFHVMFYASRTLPNMFAFGLTTFAFGLLLPTPNPRKVNSRLQVAIALFVFAGVIFRSEVALLLATNALWLLVIPLVSLGRLIPPFIISLIASLAISVPVDCYFWQKPLWPELWAFYYNVVQGSSSNWGTSPWHYYLLSALPRLLLNPLAIPLIALAAWSPAYWRITQRLTVPNLLFLAIYSFQPHKETRFIFYIVPPLTTAAALGATIITNTRSRSLLERIGFYALLTSIPVTFALSTVMLLASSLNYPGGEALAALRDMVRQDQGTVSTSVVTVHADVLSCMTGVTLFGVAMGSQPPTRHHSKPSATDTASGGLVVDGWGNTTPSVSLMLDKTEDTTTLADPNFWTRFDYLLVEDPAAVRGGHWDTVAIVDGFSGVEVLRPGQEDLKSVKRVGRGALVTSFRDWMRKYTGGWWLGPRMTPQILILRKVKETERAAKEVTS